MIDLQKLQKHQSITTTKKVIITNPSSYQCNKIIIVC